MVGAPFSYRRAGTGGKRHNHGDRVSRIAWAVTMPVEASPTMPATISASNLAMQLKQSILIGPKPEAGILRLAFIRPESKTLGPPPVGLIVLATTY